MSIKTSNTKNRRTRKRGRRIKMQIDINAIIEIYARKLSDAEKENVLLQAQVMMLQKQLEELQKEEVIEGE